MDAANAQALKLEREAISSLACAKQFADNGDTINSIHYSQDGQHMITSSDDDCINLYSMVTGNKTRNVNSKKYGVDLIRFASGAQCAVHCSTKVDNTIRYLSLHDNKYLRYFAGHTQRVTCLSMSPLDDMFLSVSLDKTIRLWDLRSNNCQGLMQLTSKAIAAFDPEGLIFAAGMHNKPQNYLKLYDLRSFDKGPFSSFALGNEQGCEWTGMKFSPDGKYIMLSTDGNIIRLIDAFSGSTKHILRGHENSQNTPLEASFTPCGGYVACGGSDGNICIWSVETGELITKLPSSHDSSLRIVEFNPKFFIMATACKKLSLWVPGDDYTTSV